MILATLDTGALIAMEQQKQRGMMLLRAAREHRAELLVITPVVTAHFPEVRVLGI